MDRRDAEQLGLALQELYPKVKSVTRRMTLIDNGKMLIRNYEESDEDFRKRAAHVGREPFFPKALSDGSGATT